MSNYYVDRDAYKTLAEFREEECAMDDSPERDSQNRCLFTVESISAESDDCYTGLFLIPGETEVYVWDNDKFLEFIEAIEQTGSSFPKQPIVFCFEVRRPGFSVPITFDCSRTFFWPRYEGVYEEGAPNAPISPHETAELAELLRDLHSKIEALFEQIRVERDMEPNDYGRSLQFTLSHENNNN